MKIGDMITTWFSDSPSGLSRIIAIEPYRGRYPKAFTHVVTATAPRTRRGTLQFAVKASERR